ncbi:MAG: type II secretion system F family protein [Clostridia bacterium]
MQFHVHAVDARQQVVSLTLEAVSEAAALELARVRGLAVFSINSSKGVFDKKLVLKRSGKFPTLLFSMELASLLEAGLNLVEGLTALAEKSGDAESGRVLPAILTAIQRGEPFSQAIAAWPQHFSPLYVATIKASERTGNVREALGRYIAYQQELEKVKKKIVSATIYPAILAVVGALVLGFLMFYVVPRFAVVYEDMQGTLPFFSRALLAFGSFVGHNAWAIAVVLGGLVFTLAWFLSRAETRAWLNTRIWTTPAIGERLKVYQLARLYRTAGMLLKAGIPAVKALDMVRELLPAHLQPQLERARRSIEHGNSMSAALADAGLATPVAVRMMSVGERSGDMGGMFAQIARFHDDEVARFIDWFTRAFEPLLMTVLGVSVGLVVVLMYMPIFELAGNIR